MPADDGLGRGGLNESVWKAFFPGLGIQQAQSAAGLLKMNTITWRPHNPDRRYCPVPTLIPYKTGMWPWGFVIRYMHALDLGESLGAIDGNTVHLPEVSGAAQCKNYRSLFAFMHCISLLTSECFIDP